MREYCTRYINLDYRHELFNSTINTDQKMNLIIELIFSQTYIKQIIAQQKLKLKRKLNSATDKKEFKELMYQRLTI